MTGRKRVHIVPGQLCAANCGFPLRPRGRTEEDHPGTRPHGRLGQCTTCFQRALRAGKTPTAPTTAPVVVDPDAPRVPVSWWIEEKPKPAVRQRQPGGGQHVYEYVPADPPHITAAARRTVAANAHTPHEAAEWLAMLGLDQETSS